MNILILSAYDAESHKSWRLGLVAAFPEHTFTTLALPPRYFSWRIRGNSLSFSDSLKHDLCNYDLVVATSMVDLSTLIGLVPKLAKVPSLLYFHENQFAFPETDHTHSSIEPKMVTLYSALSASALAFNSRYNFDTYCDGLIKLLKRFPDEVPSNLVDQIKIKSQILPVPLLDDVFSSSRSKKYSFSAQPWPVIVWNHRWEYDKGPDRFLALLKALPVDARITFHILGQRFKTCPDEMEAIKQVLTERAWLGHWGPIDSRERYLECLSSADVVLSTSIQDFQGLSVLEAMAGACAPVVPNRLAYLEYVDSAYRYCSFDDDLNSEAKAAAEKLMSVLKLGRSGANPGVVDHLSWDALRPAYRAAFDRAIKNV